jgi:hypothetical protein
MGWKLAIGVIFLFASVSFAEETNRLKTLEKGHFSGIQEALRLVITNKTQWEELWGRHNAQKIPKPAAPEIDFTKESLVFVSSGRKRTGGYSIEISEVRRSADKTEVLVTEKEPKPGGFNIQALTAPFHIVQVPKLEGEIKFRTVENKKGG